jgi:asparagine synthase (glutamine-hydrolysing)
MQNRFLLAISEDPRITDCMKIRMSKRSELGIEAPFTQLGSAIVFTNTKCERSAPDTIVIGRAFPREGGTALGIANEAREGIVSAWGGCIVVSTHGRHGHLSIFRPPFGSLPCFWAKTECATLVASDIELLLAAGLPRPAIDPALLARHLAAEDLRRNDTCLSGVLELRGGTELLVRTDQVRVEERWSPWDFAAEDAQIVDAGQAAQCLRDAAIACVSAQASTFGQILLKLSGGLDSSLVAACLKECGRPFLSLTLVTQDPTGDERPYARLAASAAGSELLERFRIGSEVDLKRSAAARLPRPSARAFTQETARIAGEVARERGCEAIFDGGGGDNLFCSLQSARPAADCILSRTGRDQFVPTVVSIAELVQSSIWRIASRAWRISRRSSPAYRWNLDTRFLSSDARAEAPGAARHPWLDAPSGALPGKSAHLALIAAAQSVAEGFDPLEEIPTFSPLIAPALVETCLRIPSWMWFKRGCNRAIARHALSGILPPELAWRRSKGAPDGFIANLYESNRSAIRTMLLGGALQAFGLLDRSGIQSFLDDDAPVRGHDYLRIMQLVDAEAWARNWS